MPKHALPAQSQPFLDVISDMNRFKLGNLLSEIFTYKILGIPKSCMKGRKSKLDTSAVIHSHIFTNTHLKKLRNYCSLWNTRGRSVISYLVSKLKHIKYTHVFVIKWYNYFFQNVYEWFVNRQKLFTVDLINCYCTRCRLKKTRNTRMT